MNVSTIPLLVTLDENYLPQLKVLMTSVYVNHPGQPFEVWLLHSRISPDKITLLQTQLARFGYPLHAICVPEDLFAASKITDRYPREMYYRLLAARWLPETMDRILYLDPDTLVINSLLPLWQTDFNGCLFAAAAHTGKTEIANDVNRIRLHTDNDYYNSGVLLINLALCRTEIDPETIFDYASCHAAELLMPDQDILNAVYGSRILPLDDALWNYDARNYSNYLLRSDGERDLEWVMKNTAILHFNGRDKPWKPGYHRRFGTLYRHYMSLTDRYLGTDSGAC